MSYYYPYSYLIKRSESYETLPINATYRIFGGSEDARDCFELHNHEALEFNAVMRGKLCMTLDGREYLLSRGEVLLANPYALHSGKWAEDCSDGEYLTLIIHLPKLLTFCRSPLEQALGELVEGCCKFDEFYPSDSTVFACIDNINRLYHDKSAANDALCLGQVYTLLGTLLGSHYHSVSDKAIQRNSGFLKKVGGYISKNYMNKITTQTAADALYMEISQFCRTFRRYYGESFTNHLCRYRVMRAAELYKNSKTSISVIAKDVGFRDYCYFSRSFKRYIGVPPALYFGKWKKTQKGE